MLRPGSNVNVIGEPGAPSGKAEDEGVAGATSRIRNSPVDCCGTGMAKHVTPGASSGWREPMVICGTDHLQGQRLGQRLQGQGIDDWCQSTSDSQ